ncbi:54S ribosomal protein L44 [Lachnellula suecica]|uniref:Large ribosomal subunit protein mL53 n=1 Tax=Lachnellula suecica TaxID=602035 RepID=A0A8T9BTE3_9HELO|nr:54S ribosomal protein L44 [Lachnellula suecica]
MITRFLTEVSTVFNPFSPKAKTARLFLSFLPSNARQTIKINTKMLPKISREPSFVELKFSKKSPPSYARPSAVLSLMGGWLTMGHFIEDGKQMKLDAEKLGIKGVVEEVDRHSRILSRQEELTGN